MRANRDATLRIVEEFAPPRENRAATDSPRIDDLGRLVLAEALRRATQCATTRQDAAEPAPLLRVRREERT